MQNAFFIFIETYSNSAAQLQLIKIIQFKAG
jgi:hypothetical protein